MNRKSNLDVGYRKSDGGGALAKQIFNLLCERILLFHLEPYEQISEKNVATELGVSRTPVREAMVRLSELGLVDIFPQRGTVVAPLRIRDLKTSQFVREALEISILKRALAEPDQSDLVQKLRSELTIQKAFVDVGDVKRFYASDENFHAIIASHAGLPSILVEIERAKIHVDRFRHLMLSGIENLETILRQHTAIVDSIENGKFAECEKAMQAHLRRILEFVDESKQRYPKYFEPEDFERVLSD